MYKNIVVGTDGSERAGVAVHHATMLARSSGATLHVVHAYRPVMLNEAAVSATSNGRTLDVEGVNAGIAANADDVCGGAAAHARSSGVIVETHAVRGDPSDALTEVAQDVGADLVVVGNRGMTGLKRFVLGNVPNKLSHHAPCSILIVDTSRSGADR
ncbi:MAG TPA: universal stress protein [Acidimicrobiales bacterium]|jgi:nucleotide-binding universal stress UspA family protein|nr:universal stress protein [Acidimicrobiales bacterium]